MQRASLERYWRLQNRLVPGLRYSQRVYEDLLRTSQPRCLDWLDLGCGHQLLPPWRQAEESELVSAARLVIGLDYDLQSLRRHRTIRARVRGDIGRLPFADESFDLVTSNMVGEHLAEPARALRETSRVMRRRGRLILHTPNLIGYSTLMARLLPQAIKNVLVRRLEGREEEDVFPALYRMNTPRRIRQLAESTGLRVVDLRLICSQAKFATFAPLALLELLWIRLLIMRGMKPLRTNILAILEKP
ncbi:MAG: class I SAM-dependent methyltransferase [Candidatus Eisenbacteria sp.]|nr:class I SAM-dependent methyltransferase [Candidatus Eisenbacteria bacterium]